MSMLEIGPPGPQGTAPKVTVFVDRCAGCQDCVVRCPTGALSMDEDLWVAASDDELCVGCRQCVRTCPFGAITVDGPLVVGPRTELPAYHPQELTGDVTETRRTFSSWEEAVTETQRCLLCPDPTCMRGCPAHNDIPGFIEALRDGDLDGAHARLRLTSAMPDVCARVCDHDAQCEGACTWALAGGQPVAIGAIERFICDSAPVPPPGKVSSDGEGLSVAVVGSGPAGVAAAWEFIQAGACVTVYEREQQPLGVLRWGIPDFTLPQHVVDRPWQQLTAAGADFRLATQVFPEDIDGLLAEHDAVLLCHGATRSRGLPVPGSDLRGVEDATSFLERGKAALASGTLLPELAPGPGKDSGPARKRVVFVLGAGDTAMDVCRTARRMDAEVVCLNRRDREHARTRPDELAEAEHDGVQVRFGTTISKIEGEEGQVSAVYLAPTRQRRGDAPPRVLAHKAVREQADLVVSATGYLVDPGFAAALPGTATRREAGAIAPRRWTASGLLMPPPGPDNRRSDIGAAALNREMDLAAARLAFRPRVWVAGDALTGPSTVVEAMAQGREAAQAILLDRPRRPGLEAPGGPRRVLVAYESETGRTKRAGATLAGALAAAGAEVRAAHLRDVQTPDLAWADLLVIGTWVEGMVVAAVRPAKGTRAFLRRLPLMAGKKVVLYCTYAVSPGKSLAIMRRGFERAGARVVAEGGFSQWSLASQPDRFGRELIDTLWPPMTDFEIADKARELAAADAAEAVAELTWLAAGRRSLLQDARAILRRELRGHPEDETAHAAARLVTAALAQETPIDQVGRPEGCIA